MHRQAAVRASVDHRADSAVQVTGNGRQVDFHQGPANAGIAQAPPDVVTLVNIAQLDTMAIRIQAMQGIGQGDFSVPIVGGVIKHADRLLPFGQCLHGLQPACLQGFGLQH